MSGRGKPRTELQKAAFEKARMNLKQLVRESRAARAVEDDTYEQKLLKKKAEIDEILQAKESLTKRALDRVGRSRGPVPGTVYKNSKKKASEQPSEADDSMMSSITDISEVSTDRRSIEYEPQETEVEEQTEREQTDLDSITEESEDEEIEIIKFKPVARKGKVKTPKGREAAPVKKLKEEKLAETKLVRDPVVDQAELDRKNQELIEQKAMEKAKELAEKLAEQKLQESRDKFFNFRRNDLLGSMRSHDGLAKPVTYYMR